MSNPNMPERVSAAEAILRRLKQKGVNYLFANAGTDFAPIIEAYESLPGDAVEAFPMPLVIPHESVAVAMAHGFYLVTGQPQAVMVHVNVGLANAVMGLLNAQSDNIPLLMLAGRTPLTEYQRPGSRMTPIQYGQEMRDQASMVRENVKWDYELRYGEQAVDALDRAFAIAMSVPRGPVFLGLPREPLAETICGGRMPEGRGQLPTGPSEPDPSLILQLAKQLARAKQPLIICQRGDTAGELAAALDELASRHAIAVVEPFPVRNVMAAHHPMHQGYGLGEDLMGADLLIVLDAPVPWIQRFVQPSAHCYLAHIGEDPLFSQLPMRNHPVDLALKADPARALWALMQALDLLGHNNPARAERLALGHRQRRQALADQVESRGAEEVITPVWVANVLGEILDEDSLVFSELGPPPGPAQIKGANRWFTPPFSGGLGWGLPAALGAKLAQPERLVVSCVGDGSYMFANPVACHQVAESLSLPILTLVLNNSCWNATRRAVHNMYPLGAAAQREVPVLTDLSPSPDYCLVASASRCWTARVRQPQDLRSVLECALHVIREEGRPALVEIEVAKTDGF